MQVGEKVGQYVIEAALGEGGMGVVYVARHTLMDRKVVLKALHDSLRTNPEFQRRFIGEIRASALLSHPNVLTTFDAGESAQGEFYLVSEYLQGQSLDVMTSIGASPLEEVLDWMIQAALGLAHIHDQGIVHRDIKPGNLFLERCGQVQVLDFGIAKFRNPLPTSAGAPLSTAPTANRDGTSAQWPAGQPSPVRSLTATQGSGDSARPSKRSVWSRLRHKLEGSPAEPPQPGPAREVSAGQSLTQESLPGVITPTSLDDSQPRENQGDSDAARGGLARQCDDSLNDSPSDNRPPTLRVEAAPNLDKGPRVARADSITLPGCSPRQLGTPPDANSSTPEHDDGCWDDMLQTRAGAVMGTPAYMSPEHCTGTTDLDFRADIYSLGCTMFHLLTGRVVYGNESIGSVLRSHLVEPAPSLRSSQPDLPREIERVFQKMVVKRPEQRYQSMHEVVAALRAVRAKPTIFISYRRNDSLDATDRLFNAIRPAFGDDNLFMDVDTIPAGVDFREHLRDAVAKCHVMLVVIGDHWLTASHEDGLRRLDDGSDLVRIEIESALEQNIGVIPVLVGRASMPSEHDLPPSIKPLAYHNAAELRAGQQYLRHVEKLTDAILRMWDAE